MTYQIPEHILEKSDQLARDGRIIGGNWRKGGGDDGAMEMVCALASWENGKKINAVDDCPVNYAPRWLLDLVPTLDDGLPTDARRAEFVLGLNLRARKWPKLDDAAWEHARIDFLKACIRQALESAERVQPTPKPSYWDKVHDACGLVIVALDGSGDLKAAGRRATAAALAALAAAAAGRWATAAALAALAAEAAAGRWATATALAAAAAEVGRSKAYERLVDVLFKALDKQLENH